MMQRILIWERTLGEPYPAGELICEIESNGRIRSAFRYHKHFLSRNDAFALDPVSLPLGDQIFTHPSHGIFGVFEDSLPDSWGRNLLVRKHKLPRHEQTLPRLLLALGNNGLGALSFNEGETSRRSTGEATMIDLATLVESAEKFEHGESEDTTINLLLSAGSSPGGARPKALVFDEAAQTHYLAKFPSTKDIVDVVRIEAATMVLAREAKLIVPTTQLMDFSGRPVLLVERFDISDSGRRHMISFQTLLKAAGYYQHRYKDLLDVLRKYSSTPTEDSQSLFRQMVFNAVIGNRDDHLKNFLMLYDHIAGWHLSPAFDLIPDVNQRGEHILFFDWDARYPGKTSLERLGRQWSIPEADRIVSDVFEAVATWRAAFARAGVTDADITKFIYIDRHLSSK